MQTTGLPTKGDDVLLSFSTLYWISGILMYIIGGVRGSCRVITTESFTPELLLELIEEHRVSSYILVLLLPKNTFTSF